MIDSTGPKISSCAILMSRLTFEKMVGRAKRPTLKVVGPPRPANDKLGAFLQADADHGLDTLELRRVGDRTMGRAFRKRIADHQFRSGRRRQDLDLCHL